jgi:predicted transcriptional regulator
MGRPLKWGEPTEVLTVRIPASLKKRLTQQAEQINRPVAEVVVRALGYK